MSSRSHDFDPLDHVTHAVIEGSKAIALCRPEATSAFLKGPTNRPAIGEPTCNACQRALAAIEARKTPRPKTRRKLTSPAVAVPANHVRSTRAQRQAQHLNRIGFRAERRNRTVGTYAHLLANRYHIAPNLSRYHPLRYDQHLELRP